MLEVNNVTYIDETDDIKIGMFCRICEYLLSSAQDIESSREFGCCNECYVTFVESREKAWNDGWRPDDKTLNRYKASRRILISNLNKILEDVYESKF